MRAVRLKPQPPEDYEQEVEITLEEAFRGTQRLLDVDGRRLEVKIPAGVKTGLRVRMAGEGPGGSGWRFARRYLPGGQGVAGRESSSAAAMICTRKSP